MTWWTFPCPFTCSVWSGNSIRCPDSRSHFILINTESSISSISRGPQVQGERSRIENTGWKDGSEAECFCSYRGPELSSQFLALRLNGLCCLTPAPKTQQPSDLCRVPQVLTHAHARTHTGTHTDMHTHTNNKANHYKEQKEN